MAKDVIKDSLHQDVKAGDYVIVAPPRTSDNLAILEVIKINAKSVTCKYASADRGKISRSSFIKINEQIDAAHEKYPEMFIW